MNERNRSKKGWHVVIYSAINPNMDYSSFLIKSQSNNAFATSLVEILLRILSKILKDPNRILPQDPA